MISSCSTKRTRASKSGPVANGSDHCRTDHHSTLAAGRRHAESPCQASAQPREQHRTVARRTRKVFKKCMPPSLCPLAQSAGFTPAEACHEAHWAVRIVGAFNSRCNFCAFGLSAGADNIHRMRRLDLRPPV